ncbi:hypothetical protein JTB14_017847 [Gonioctena quinquepunctata]|nr:hypothetical protein JTB14_017847 [Gonioctena quinquepunctata]
MKNVKGNISPSLPREIGSYQVPAEQETSCNFPQDKKEMNGYISPPLPEKADVSLRPTNPKAFPILISHVSPVSENEVGTEPEKYFVIPQNVEELKDISSQPPKQQYVFLPQTEKESEQKPLDFPQDVEKIRKNISSPSSSEKVYASRPQSEEESTIWMIPTREGIINHQVHAQQESQRVIGFPQDIKNVEGNISPLLPKEIGNYQVPAKQETSFGLPQDKKDIHGNISPPLPGKANVPLPPTYPEKCPILMSSVSSVSPVSENKVGTEPEKSSVIPQNVAESKDISPQSPKQEYVSLLQTEKKSCIWLTPTRKESAEYQEQENPYDFPQNVKEISKNISPPTSSEKVYASRSQSGVENVIWIIPTREEIDNHQVCAQQEIPLGSPHVIDKVKGNISPPLPEKACVPLPEPEKESSVWLTSTRRKSNVHQVPNEEGKPFVKDIRENISHPSSEKVYASRPQSEKESAVWFIPVRKEIDNYQVPAEQETSIGIPQDIKVSNGIISPQLPVETYVSLPQPEIESSVWLTPTRKESDNHQVQTEHEKPPNFPQNIEVTKGNILPPSPEGVYVSRPQLEKETVVWLTRQEEPIDLLQVDENLKKPEPSSPNPTTKEFLDYLSTISTKYENQNSQGRNGEPIDLTEVTEVMRKFIESIPMKKKESLPPDVRYISTTPLENVERECDNSPPETRKEKPISIPPVIIIESTQQILEEVANSEHPKESPIYPPNISKESPIPLPPVIDNSSTTSLLHSKEAPISLPPVLEETATNQEKLIPLPSIPHKPITYYPKCTDVPYSEAHPERQFIEFEGRLNKSLVPYDCPCTTCREKPRLLLSYPIHQEQHLPNEEKRVNIIGCPCCQSKGYCDCCQRKGCCNCRRDPHVPFGKRFPTDVDALQQVATPYFNNRETHILPKQESPKQDYNGAIPQTHSTGYSSSMTSGYSSEFSQNGNHKPKVNIEGYRSSSGSGYYSDPSNDVFYQGPSVVDVVRTPDPHEPVLEHTRIEQPNRYKIVQKYEMVPKVVKPLIITELVPTNVFVCEQSDGAHPARTVCHREYAPVERRQGEQAPEDIVRRPAEEHVCGGDMRRNYISRNYFLDNAVGDIRRAPVTRDNCFIRPLEEDIKPVNFNVLRGLRQDVPVAVTPQITREINPIEVLNIASVKGVIEMVPTSHFIPCRRRPRQTANGTEATEN